MSLTTKDVLIQEQKEQILYAPDFYEGIKDLAHCRAIKSHLVKSDKNQIIKNIEFKIQTYDSYYKAKKYTASLGGYLVILNNIIEQDLTNIKGHYLLLER